MSVIGLIIRKFTERSGQKLTLAEWQRELEKSGEGVNGRFKASTLTDKHQNIGRPYS